jgi:metal-responsive CopG/Arc/MetJ family transcriptional regulator
LYEIRRVGTINNQERKRIGYNWGYTLIMKTAVSVPDDLFRLAEAAARRLRVSRSQLYATAISEFLNRQQSDAITERLNEVYSRHPAKVDPALQRAQLKSLEKDSW